MFLCFTRLLKTLSECESLWALLSAFCREASVDFHNREFEISRNLYLKLVTASAVLPAKYGFADYVRVATDIYREGIRSDFERKAGKEKDKLEEKLKALRVVIESECRPTVLSVLTAALGFSKL